MDQHREGVRASLDPHGALELADRVALTLWRLGRVARAEALATTADIANAVLPKPLTDEEALYPRAGRAAEAARKARGEMSFPKWRRRSVRAVVCCLDRLPAAADGDRVSARTAGAVVRAATDLIDRCDLKADRPRRLAGPAAEKWAVGPGRPGRPGRGGRRPGGLAGRGVC